MREHDSPSQIFLRHFLNDNPELPKEAQSTSSPTKELHNDMIGLSSWNLPESKLKRSTYSPRKDCEQNQFHPQQTKSVKDCASIASCLLAVCPYNVIILDDNDYEDDDDVAKEDIQTITFLCYSKSLVLEISEEDLKLWLGLTAYSRNPLGPKGGNHISQRDRHLYTENKKPKTKTET